MLSHSYVVRTTSRLPNLASGHELRLQVAHTRVQVVCRARDAIPVQVFQYKIATAPNHVRGFWASRKCARYRFCQSYRISVRNSVAGLCSFDNFTASGVISDNYWLATKKGFEGNETEDLEGSWIHEYIAIDEDFELLRQGY